MGWRCWFNIWATCQMNTKWDGEENEENVLHHAKENEEKKQKTSLFEFYSTKIFIRHPRTLYATEDAYERCKHELGEF